MNPIQVEKNEWRTATTPVEALSAHDIREEIVVVLYDAETRIGGIVRFTQPDSRVDAGQARQTPAKYADSGIAILMAEASRQGANKGRATVHIVGGAHITQAEAVAKKNYLAARKNLWKIGLVVASEAVGGGVPRNVRLQIGTGCFWVSESGHSELDAARHSGQDQSSLKGGTDLCLTVC